MQRNIQKVAFTIAVVFIIFFGGRGAWNLLSPKLKEVEPEFVLSYGEVNLDGHIMTETAHYFAECVKALSKGKVLIKIYSSGQLGDDAKCYQSMKMGALDFYRGNCASLTGTEVPMISIMSLPYLFDDSEHFWRVCNSELGKQILEEIQDSMQGLRGLAFVDEGVRNFFTTNKPISKLEDMKGLNIRMQVSDLMLDTVSALGATAVPLEYVELYTALESKMVDGAENPLISYYYNKFYEVAPYYVKNEHTYSPGVILMSDITWEKLGEEYQSVIMEAAVQTQEYNRSKIKEAEQSVYEELREQGVMVTELTDLEEWRKAVEPVYQKYGVQFMDIINEIKNMR